MKNSQIGGDMDLNGVGHVDLAGAFVKGTADLRGTILSPDRVENARFGQLFYDASTKFMNNEGTASYEGTVSTGKDSRGWFFIFS